MKEATELAGRIAANPPQVLRWTKKLLREARNASLDEILDLSAAYQALAHDTADHREAIAALFEKRPPNFSGQRQQPPPKAPNSLLAIKMPNDHQRFNSSFVNRNSAFFTGPRAPFEAFSPTLQQVARCARISCMRPCNASRRPARGLLL